MSTRLWCCAMLLSVVAPVPFALRSAAQELPPTPDRKAVSPVQEAVASRNSPVKTLLIMKPGVQDKLKPSSTQVSTVLSPDVAKSGLSFTVQPGADAYPGVALVPEGGILDLSAFGHVTARVINTGTTKLTFCLRVDNAGDWRQNPWNAESLTLQPGESGTVKTIFGYSWGYHAAYPLKSNAVTGFVLFVGKSDAVQSFRLESLTAEGPAGEKPPVDPASVREKPRGGALLGGGAVPLKVDQVTAQNAQFALVGGPQNQALQITLPAKGGGAVTLKPAMGRWDLGEALEVRAKIRNTGQTPVTPRLRLDTNGGSSGWVAASAPLAPGAVGELAVPFISEQVALCDRGETGSQLATQLSSGIVVGALPAEGEQTLRVESLRATVPPSPVLPGWLGQRPPVGGEWVKTLDENFNGQALDETLWSMYGDNPWDKVSHWSKDDVLYGGGTVRLRYEKKTGPANDDPGQKSSPYAAGYLHTYGKWTQRYGYFEARLKLPTSPGLWPAFWMMPERGPQGKDAPSWKRQDTGAGGMEFDIMEHLTAWGPNRYNVAMHWDGYGDKHKSNGTSKLYLQPDKDGYITTGLLWLPGSAVYYANGREVARWDNERISNVPSMLMFTLPSGGWENSPLDDTKLPAEFTIDYVRAWQRKDLASALDGKKKPLAP